MSGRKPAAGWIGRRAAALLLVAVALAPAVAAETPATLGLSAGAFDFEKDARSEAGLELRLRDGLPWGLAPIVGVAGNEADGVWLHLGLARSFARGPVRLTPSFAVAHYERERGKNLGGELQFRSGIELSHLWPGGSEIGLGFYHLSNAGIEEPNPGSNSLIVVFRVPLSRRGE